MENKKNISKGFFEVGLSMAINLLLGVLITPIITRMVNPSEYGQFSIFTMYTNIAIMVLCLGLDQALVRYFYNVNTLSYKKKLFAFCYYLPMIIAFVCSALLIIVSYVLGNKLKFNTIITIFLCVNILVCLWNRFSQLLLRVSSNTRVYSICNILHRLFYLLFAILFIYLFNKNNLIALVLATILSFLIPNIVSFFYTKEYWNPHSDPNVKLNYSQILKYSMPFIISMGLTTLFQATDKIFLDYFSTDVEVGIYASAMNIIGLFSIIQATFNTIWSPLMIEQLTKKPEDHTLIEKANKYITVIMFGFGLCLIIFKDVLVYMLGDDYRDASFIFPFLVLFPIMYTISETTVGGIELSQKSYIHVIISLICLLFNVAGNYLLVPKYNCIGAAISTGISYILFYILRTLFSLRYYKVNYSLVRMFILTTVTIVLASYTSFHHVDYIAIILFLIGIISIIVLYYRTILELLSLIKSFILNHVKGCDKK